MHTIKNATPIHDRELRLIANGGAEGNLIKYIGLFNSSTYEIDLHDIPRNATPDAVAMPHALAAVSAPKRPLGLEVVLSRRHRRVSQLFHYIMRQLHLATLRPLRLQSVSKFLADCQFLPEYLIRGESDPVADPPTPYFPDFHATSRYRDCWNPAKMAPISAGRPRSATASAMES